MAVSEQERAAYYHAHKDDPDLFGDAEPSPVPKGTKMGISLTVRLSADDAAHLQRLSKVWRCTYSDAVRRALRIADSPFDAVSRDTSAFGNSLTFTRTSGYFRPLPGENVPLSVDPAEY